MSNKELIREKLAGVNTLLQDIDLKGLNLKKRNYLCGVQIIQRGNAFDDINPSMILEVTADLDETTSVLALVGPTDSEADEVYTNEELIKAVVSFFHSAEVKNYYNNLEK